MLYIQKEGPTLTVQKADQTMIFEMSLKQFLTQRILKTEGCDVNIQAKLKGYYHRRYFKPWFIASNECYVATHAITSFSTFFINAMRVLSVEQSGLETLVVFDTGRHLKLAMATKHFKRRWLEAIQFVKAQQEKSYKRFHR